MSASARLLGIRLPRAQLAGGLGPVERLEHTLPADLGMSIVGHTTPEAARLWFHLPFEPASNHSFACHVAPARAGVPAPAAGPVEPGADLGPAFALTFDQASNTAVARATGLSPGRAQDYSLVLQRGTSRFVLAGGRFRTPTSGQTNLASAFGSCHLPVVTGTPDQPSPEAVRSLELWQRLDARDDAELLLLVGDQIYGDGIEEKWPNEDDFSRYLRRYRQLWAHRPTRSVLRATPTYMILDDHDVADDFGLGDLDDNKVDGALLAYRLFQHAHGPSDSVSAPFHSSFRRGPAAFFVMDGRTQRGEGTPVFGQRQLADLRAWARHPDTRAADLIFFVAPVPLALLPTEIIRKVVDELTEQAFVTAGVLGGLGIGLGLAALGIPAPFPGIGGAVATAAVLGAVGYGAAEVLEDHIDRTLLLKADLGERWDLADNQPDLVRLLDLLFDPANGVGDDPPRRGPTLRRRPADVDVADGPLHQQPGVLSQVPAVAVRVQEVLALAVAEHVVDIDRALAEPLPVGALAEDLQDVDVLEVEVEVLVDPRHGLDPQRRVHRFVRDRRARELGDDRARAVREPAPLGQRADQVHRCRVDVAGEDEDRTFSTSTSTRRPRPAWSSRRPP